MNKLILAVSFLIGTSAIAAEWPANGLVQSEAGSRNTFIHLGYAPYVTVEQGLCKTDF